MQFNRAGPVAGEGSRRGAGEKAARARNAGEGAEGAGDARDSRVQSLHHEVTGGSSWQQITSVLESSEPGVHAVGQGRGGNVGARSAID